MSEVMTSPATMELLSRGMDCLVRNMGVIDAEYFIAAVQREKFDYTKWQQQHFDNLDLHTFINNAVEYEMSEK